MSKLVKRSFWSYFLFWSWNIIFLSFILLGLLPLHGSQMIQDVSDGLVSPVYLGYLALLIVVPLVAVILGATRLRTAPDKLFMLAYGVEWPLMILVLIRFFVIREMTPPVGFILGTAGLGFLVLLWHILDSKIDQRGLGLSYLRLAGASVTLTVGLYASLWGAFYAPPAAASLFQFVRHIPTIFSDTMRHNPEYGLLFIFFTVCGMALFVFTGSLLVVMPVAVPYLCGRTWWQAMTNLANRQTPLPALALTGVVIVSCVGIFLQTNYQAQQEAFALLDEPPANRAEEQALLAEAETIRAGLLNSYLAPYRYFSSVGEVGHIREMYEYTLDMPPNLVTRIEGMYAVVASPLLYQPVELSDPDQDQNWRQRWQNRALSREPAQAAELYQQFFDQPINQGERERVIQAARTTWSREQGEAARQAVDERDIHVTRQELTVTEHNDWAEFELYEVYENQTNRTQEVVYYFNLPESAVITGVWLGTSPDRDSRFVYRVAPRGAAQEIYRRQVQVNLDPALLEQIGPRQYRLRVFPIEPRRINWLDNTRQTIDGPPLHMWFTWQVLATDTHWPLPRLAVKRNAYWDHNTVRLVNGQPMAVDEASWLPDSLPISDPITPVSHRVDFPGQRSVIIQPESAADVPDFPETLQLAVVLDRSRSMVAVEEKVTAALNRLATLPVSDLKVDLYLTASPYRGEEPSVVALSEISPEEIIYYGGQSPAELLVQFNQLYQGQTYDAIFVLTDSGGYELGKAAEELTVPSASVWLVHLADNLSLGYDDATLEAIQASGGGAVGSVETGLTRLFIALEAGEEGAGTRDLIDGYVWLTDSPGEETTDMVTHKPTDQFAAFAARRLILAEMYRHRQAITNNDVLDDLHAIAIEHSIVTYYSSMIVLVNDRQHRQLDRLEQRADRFAREHEQVGETAPMITGVPEPEEWLLIGLAVVMLVAYFYQQRRQAWAS